jgi:small-conductance mechanosensitive channel
MLLEIIETAQMYIYDLSLGIIILLIGLIIGILAKKIIYRLLREVRFNNLMKKIRLNYDWEKGLSLIIPAFIYLITLILFLNHLGITSVVIYLISGALLILLALAIIVGMKDVIPNLVGGITLRWRGQLEEGKKIEIKNVSGMVQKIGLMETEIKTEKGDLLYLPNSIFVNNNMKIKK